jgi:predicted enzyme related to lactoylglutathione lyase
VWHELSTDDLPAAQRFYGGLLGWEFRETTRVGRRCVPVAAASFYTSTFGYQQEVTDRAGPNAYVVLSLGRPRAGILQSPEPEIRPVWLPSILVSDPAVLAARATSLGGRVLLAPHPDVRKGSLAVVADPSGAIVALQKYPF